MRGATRGGTVEPTSRDQNTRQEWGQGKGDIRKSHEYEDIFGVQKEAARQSRAAPLATKQKEESSTCVRTEITVATHNVRMMTVDETHGVGRALDVLNVYDRLGCDVIGLQETRRSGYSAFIQASDLVYCSDECGGENGGKKAQGGVGLAVRTSITRAARPPEFIRDRLLKITLELRGRAKAFTFFVAYAPSETQNASSKDPFWTTLDRAVEEVPRHKQLFVLMNANSRTERREKGGIGSKDDKISVPTAEIPLTTTANYCCPSLTTMT